jgi:hypothetical protein
MNDYFKKYFWSHEQKSIDCNESITELVTTIFWRNYIRTMWPRIADNLQRRSLEFIQYQAYTFVKLLMTPNGFAIHQNTPAFEYFIVKYILLMLYVEDIELKMTGESNKLLTVDLSKMDKELQSLIRTITNNKFKLVFPISTRKSLLF